MSHINTIEKAGGNALYYQLNFNDSLSSLLTLFCVLNSNNWNSYCDMYSELNGGSQVPYYYFTLYYILSIFIMLNIVVSFIMEIYSVVLDDSKPNQKKLQNLHTVRKLAPKKEDLEELIKKTPALQRPQ